MQYRSSRLSPRNQGHTIVLLFLSGSLFLAGCEEKGPFGLTDERFGQVLDTKNSAAILSLPDSSFSDPGPLGPSTYYYAARWLDALEPADGPAKPAAPAGTAAPAATGVDTPSPAPAPEGMESVPPALLDIGAKDDPAATTAAAPRARVRLLYRLAFEGCTGFLQREAGQRLVAAAAADARQAAKAGQQAQAATLWNEVLAVSQSFGDSLGADPAVRLLRLEALEALGRDAELVRECAEYVSRYPDRADDDAILYYQGVSARRIGKKAWAPSLYALLVTRPTSDWTAKALGFVSSPGTPGAPAQTDIGPEVLAAAKMRLLVRDRDYGAAYRAALGARDLVFSKAAPKALVADAGKAWLYSGSSKDGLERFEEAFGSYPADASRLKRSAAEAASAWTSSYYRARFLRALERWTEAADLFGLLTGSAPSPQDADAAAWYGIDCRMKAAKAAQDAQAAKDARLKKKVTAQVLADRASALRRSWLDILIVASATWNDPTVFSDIADSVLREALAARDWAFVIDYAQRLGPRLSPMLGSRVAYLAGRILETGLDGEKKAGSASAAKGPAKAPVKPAEATEPDIAGLASGPAAFYLAAANREGAPLYYRILSLRRLGSASDIVPPAQPGVAAAASPSGAAPGAPAATPGTEAEIEAFYMGFIALGLTDFVYPEIQARPSLGLETVRRVAQAMAAQGDYANSMRVILSLTGRPDWSATRADYEIIYPRPFLDELRAARPKPNVPEFMLYGLLRSESFFRPDIVSAAGAVGLAQLMPSTAEEIASGLGMESYDLTQPADSLRMGASHFADLIALTGGRPLRAMFAYNAGQGRLKRWLADYPGLPDDILLETLPIEETRQYGRNILQAAVFYAELYYAMPWTEAVDAVLGPGTVAGK